MRKLASIQRILELSPIPDADKIEVATVLGWKVVVGRDLHEVGDLVVYCEIDSVLDKELFPEVEKFGCRIRTIRLRGQISQGYVIPLNEAIQAAQKNGWEFKDLEGIGPLLRKKMDAHGDYEIVPIAEGNCLTEQLNVLKYEPAMKFSTGVAEGNFPSHILPKSDEDRIQSNPAYLQKFKGKKYKATVKCDGSSATFGCDGDKFFAASRNLRVKQGDNVYWNITEKYDLENKIKAIMPEIVVQGEVCGPGIQKNRLGLKEIDFFVFRAYDQNTKKYLQWEAVEEVARVLGLKTVPLDIEGDSFDFDIPDLLQLATGHYWGTTTQREGLVFHLCEDDSRSFGGWLSFKVINDLYLLADKDA